MFRAKKTTEQQVSNPLTSTGWNIVSLVVTQLLSLISFSYLSRRLSIRDYGELATIQSLIAMTWPMVGMGLVSGVVTSQVKDQANKAELRLSLSLVTWMMLTIFALVVSLPFNRDRLPILDVPVRTLWVVLVAGLGTVINVSVTSIFRAKQKTSLAAILEILLAAIVFVSTYLFFDIFDFISVMSRMTAVLLGFIPALLVIGYLTRNSIRQSPKSLKLLYGYLGIGWPLVLHSLSGWLTGSMDRLVLNKFHGPEITGQYAVSAQIGGLFGLITLLIGQIWNPLVFAGLNKGDSGELGRLVRVGGVIAGTLPLLAVIFGYLAPLVFKYILAKNYAVDGPTVIATAVKGSFDGWYYLIASPLFFYERNKHITGVTIGVGLITGAFLWIWGGSLSGFGVAVSLAVATLAQCIIIGFVTLQHKMWQVPVRGCQHA